MMRSKGLLTFEVINSSFSLLMLSLYSKTCVHFLLHDLNHSQQICFQDLLLLTINFFPLPASLGACLLTQGLYRCAKYFNTWQIWGFLLDLVKLAPPSKETCKMQQWIRFESDEPSFGSITHFHSFHSVHPSSAKIQSNPYIHHPRAGDNGWIKL